MFVEVDSVETLIVHCRSRDDLDVVEHIRKYGLKLAVIRGAGFSDIPPDILSDIPVIQQADPLGEVAYPVRSAIRDALELSSSQPFSSVYLAADRSSISEVIKCHVGTIMISGTTSGPFRPYPDFAISTLSQLDDILSDSFGGYCGEMAAAVWGGASLQKVRQCTMLSPTHDALNEVGIDVYTSGRYFPATDHRHIKHPLSAWIRKSKQVDTCDSLLVQRISKIFKPMIAALCEDLGIDAITRIPPRPSQFDRLGAFLYGACADHRNLLYLDAIRMSNSVVPDRQQSLSSLAERVENVRGAFVCDSLCQGSHILLVDDTVVSGSTAREAACTLRRAGFEKVTILALGLNDSVQDIGLDVVSDACPTPGCSGHLVLRCNGETGDLFWGCSQYWSSHCRVGIPAVEGLRRSNRSFERDDIDVLDIPF